MPVAQHLLPGSAPHHHQHAYRPLPSTYLSSQQPMTLVVIDQHLKMAEYLPHVRHIAWLVSARVPLAACHPRKLTTPPPPPLVDMQQAASNESGPVTCALTAASIKVAPHLNIWLAACCSQCSACAHIQYAVEPLCAASKSLTSTPSCAHRGHQHCCVRRTCTLRTSHPVTKAVNP